MSLTALPCVHKFSANVSANFKRRVNLQSSIHSRVLELDHDLTDCVTIVKLLLTNWQFFDLIELKM